MRMCGAPIWGCEVQSVQGSGGRGKAERGERRIAGGRQGGGSSPGRTAGVPLRNQPGTREGRRGASVHAGPCPPEGSRPHRRQRGPSSPATEPRWVPQPRLLQPQASAGPPRPLRPQGPGRQLPAPTCPFGSEPRARARPRGEPASRDAPRAPGEHAQQGRSRFSAALLRVFPARHRADGQTNQRAGAGTSVTKEAEPIRDWAATTKGGRGADSSQGSRAVGGAKGAPGRAGGLHGPQDLPRDVIGFTKCSVGFKCILTWAGHFPS